ncbi:DUF424 family protein [Candidatus Woesearchaeota archaeon]|nr:DUF424 family protein [Candidatus Woesearchaeota archaeon]
MILAKRHVRDGKLVLVVCDQKLLGKKISEGDKQLDLAAAYYQGAPISGQEFLKVLDEAYILDGVGPEATGILVKSGKISEKDLLHIAGIPYIIIYRR